MYYREDAELGMGVELHFSGNAIGGYYESVTLYDARFYKAGTVERGSYVYDEADKHRCTVGDNTVIGMGSIVLSGAVIGSNCIIGAGSLVTGKMRAELL